MVTDKLRASLFVFGGLVRLSLKGFFACAQSANPVLWFLVLGCCWFLVGFCGGFFVHNRIYTL